MSEITNGYDFGAYLSKLCPREEFQVARLTGGYINLTVRGTRKSCLLNKTDNIFKGNRSFIIKYAPDYMYVFGEDHKFSEYRQVGSLLHSWTN